MSTTVTALDSTYQTLISSILEVERQPMDTLTTKRDQVNVQKAVYSDLKSMLDGLQTSVKALYSKDVFYSLATARTSKVSGAPTNSTVFTATAGTSAAVGNYALSVTTLAKQHRVRSDRQEYIDQALGYSGSFVLGGATTSSVTASTNSTVTGIKTSALATGQTELGTDGYSVETRFLEGTGWQFRMVNTAGEAMRIKDSEGEYTTSWQSIAAGDHDTGRGLTLSFGSDTTAYTALNRYHAAPSASYTAKGATISLAKNESLSALAYRINNATYAEGNSISASIVDNHLVLTNNRAGLGNVIQAAELDGGNVLTSLGILGGSNFKNPVQSAADASFSVNGLAMTRQKNSDLSDVINGVNLNLASDAEGKAATLDINADYANETTAVNDFITKYNKVIDYLTSKVAITKNADGSYTRGSLSTDQSIVGLRLELARGVNQLVGSNGEMDSLADLGVTLSDSFKLSLSSSSKLETALKSNRSSAISVLDGIMGSLNTSLSKFTGSTGYISTYSNSLETQVKTMNTQIAAWTTRLTARQDQLITQYANVQTQISQMTALSSQLSAYWSA